MHWQRHVPGIVEVREGVVDTAKEINRLSHKGPCTAKKFEHYLIVDKEPIDILNRTFIKCNF